MNNKSVEILLNNKKIELEIIKPSIPPFGINTSNFYSKNNILFYDPGFTSTASCKSKITYIDGENGVLKYRGYNIKELAEKSNFISVSYLLFNGNLPSAHEKKKFLDKIYSYCIIEKEVLKIIQNFSKKSHTMPILMAVFSAYAAFFEKEENINNLAAIAMAKMLMSVSSIFRYITNQPFLQINPNLSFSENFIYLMFGIENTTAANAIDKILVLHADHEQNASTAAVKTSASSLVNPIAAIVAGIATLWGKLHGGANERVVNMLEEISKAQNIDLYINKAKDKNDPFRLFGFGHRIYKNYDPRAEILSKICENMISNSNNNYDSNLESLFKTAKKLENASLQDEYFIQRKLYPNVDFYSGIILRSLNIPPNMFTMIFALGRVIGWVSQLKEMLSDSEQKLVRPRQIYVGDTNKKF